MTKSKERKPQYRYIKVNETGDWNDGIVNKLGVNGIIWAVYAYDSGVFVHCCELTPSYEMIYVGTEFTTDSSYDSVNYELIDEEIREGEANLDSLYSYMYCSSVDSRLSYPLIGDYEKDEDVMEQYGSNPGCFDCTDSTLTLKQLKKDVNDRKYNHSNPSAINFIDALIGVFKRKYKRIKFEKIQYAQQLAWDECNGDDFNKVIALMDKLCRLLAGKYPFGND